MRFKNSSRLKNVFIHSEGAKKGYVLYGIILVFPNESFHLNESSALHLFAYNLFQHKRGFKTLFLSELISFIC